MDFHAAVEAGKGWGDTLSVYGDSLVVSVSENPFYGIRVFRNGASHWPVTDNPLELPLKPIVKVLKHYGADATATGRKASIVIGAGDAKSTVRGKPPGSFPTPPPDHKFVSLDSGVIERVRRVLALTAASGTPAYALDGVHLTPSYIAAGDGYRVGVVWLSSPLSGSVTVPALAFRRLPFAECGIAVDSSRIWFKGDDALAWAPRLTLPWPESTVNEMIPQRRALIDGDRCTTFAAPSEWFTALRGATLTDHDSGNPLRLTIEDDIANVAIPRVYGSKVPLPSGTRDNPPVGVNAHLLAAAMGLFAGEDTPVYVSIAGPTDTIMVYTDDTNPYPCEVIVSPHYLPS